MEFFKLKRNLYIVSLGCSLPVTLTLFFFMAHLISQPAKLDTEGDLLRGIDFIRNISELQTQTRRRSLPKKAPKPKAMPKRPKIAVSKTETPAPKMALNMPVISNPLALGAGPYLGEGQGVGGDRDEMPLVRIEPQYPRRAAIEGLEGWVRLQFDVNELGHVVNVRVLASRPARVFDRAARRALLRWKYRPKTVDGQPTPRKGLVVRLKFSLVEDS